MDRNVLVQGDAQVALAHLAGTEPFATEFARSVRLCYLDPPFNTGETFAHYSDVHERHNWLSMMRDVLVRIRSLLTPDGSVWLHLDDSAQHHGRCLLDEVFGPDAFVATIIWQKRTSRDNRKAFSSMHDYIHVYAPLGPAEWKKRRNGFPDEGAFRNPDNDPRGPWRSAPLSAQAGHATDAQFYAITTPTGATHEPPPGRCWTYSWERFQELVADGRVHWPRGGDGRPRLKTYAADAQPLAPFTIWTADEAGDTASAKKHMLRLYPDQAPFDTPKPESLMERIVRIGSDPGEYVLDCFLGSATTAVVAHRLGRRWLGIEREPHIVSTFAVPRLEAAVNEAEEAGRDPSGFSVLRVTSFVPGRAGEGAGARITRSSSP